MVEMRGRGNNRLFDCKPSFKASDKWPADRARAQVEVSLSVLDWPFTGGGVMGVGQVT